MKIKAKDIQLVRTCAACPEQYNKTIKDTAGCHAFNRDFIVTGGAE